MTVMMRDAIKPNLLQTLENTPVLVHAGPFGNIAHGNSSVIADLIGIHTGDFLITEAGFGADMGAERFFNIKCRTSGLAPDAAVVVATVRALKVHAGAHHVVAGRPLPPALLEEHPDEVHAGGANLRKQLENVAMHGVTPVVAINAFPEDFASEHAAIREIADVHGGPQRGLHPLRRRGPGRGGAGRSRGRGSRGALGVPAPVPERRVAAREDRDHRHPGLRRRRRRLRTGRSPPARQLRAQRVRQPCRSASPRPTSRSPRTRASEERRRAGGFRCGRCAPRWVRGSSTPSAATCAPCPACRRIPPPSASTSTRTATSSACREPSASDGGRGGDPTRRLGRAHRTSSRGVLRRGAPARAGAEPRSLAVALSASLCAMAARLVDATHDEAPPTIGRRGAGHPRRAWPRSVTRRPRLPRGHRRPARSPVEPDPDDRRDDRVAERAVGGHRCTHGDGRGRAPGWHRLAAAAGRRRESEPAGRRRGGRRPGRRRGRGRRRPGADQPGRAPRRRTTRRCSVHFSTRPTRSVDRPGAPPPI